MREIKPMLAAMVFTASAAAASAAATAPAALVAQYAAQAGVAPEALVADRGERLFRGEHRTAEGKTLSCASCHTPDPRRPGRTQVGKPIEPLAPAANAARFTDAAKAEKWFGRNCKHVLERECTPQEKGEFVAWLMTLK